MINVAVVGMGGIGNNHAGCYEKNPHARVAAVVDVIPEKREAAAKKFGCPAFESVESLLGAGQPVDAASVCTSGKENGGDHYAPTMALLRANVPVLGEKPISNRLDEAREMVSLARERRIPYGINLNHRFTPAARRAREWVDAGRLGEMNVVNMMMWINNPNESAEHFHMRALHPHSLDVMRYFAGPVSHVHAFFKKGKGRKVWSNVQVNLLFESGVIGHLLGSYDGGGPGHPWGLERCELVGSDARIVIDNACEKLVYSPRKDGQEESHECLGGMKGFGETFQSRIDAWVDDLRNGTPPEKVDGKAEDALRAQQIIEGAIESWEQRSVVAVEG